MNNTPQIITERIDDFVLLIQVLKQMGVVELFDNYLARHGLHQGLGWGWLGTIWLSHIISQGDHRKLTVRDWVRQAHHTLEKVTGLSIRDTDFTDDRLTLLLENLSNPEAWSEIEIGLGKKTIRVYDLEQQIVRLDATTVSGYHDAGDDSLFQFGNSKDNPALRQIKVMMASLDPLGFPLATSTVSGQRADDGLYIPAIDQSLKALDQKGLLFVGDCKMASLSTRAHVDGLGHRYLCPLPLTGTTAKQMPTWIQEGLDGSRELRSVFSRSLDKNDKNIHLGKGYEFYRDCSAEQDDKVVKWQERVILICSDKYAEIKSKNLEKRIENAIEKLQALTPAPARGKRQIRDEEKLKEKAEAIITDCKVEGLIQYHFECEVTQKTTYVGRGRGSKDREKKTTQQVRYQITSVERLEDSISTLKKTLGWKAYVTNESVDRLSFENAVLTYRDEWTIERGFRRLKGAPLSLDPVFVKRNDQIIGLTNLLSIALRALTVIEFVVRRSLQENNEKLTGLHAENPQKGTDRPTAERILKAFSQINLTIVELAGQVFHHVTPLSPLQTKILDLLGLGEETYSGLAVNSE